MTITESDGTQTIYSSLVVDNNLEHTRLRIILGVRSTNPSTGDSKVQKDIPPDWEFVFSIWNVHLQRT